MEDWYVKHTGYRPPETPDPRHYAVSPDLMRAEVVPDYKYWTTGPRLHQGDKPQCVAYSTKGVLQSSPIRQNPHISEQEIYDWCQANDEWAGTDYDGTSVHAAARWLKAHGYIERYEWAHPRYGSMIDQIHRHLALRGPVLVGTTWWQGMSFVDDHFFARPTGANFGGHAWFIDGTNRKGIDPVRKQRVGIKRCTNSWGSGYGKNGKFFMADPDLAVVLEDAPEVCLLVEKKRA